MPSRRTLCVLRTLALKIRKIWVTGHGLEVLDGKDPRVLLARGQQLPEQDKQEEQQQSRKKQSKYSVAQPESPSKVGEPPLPGLTVKRKNNESNLTNSFRVRIAFELKNELEDSA